MFRFELGRRVAAFACGAALALAPGCGHSTRTYTPDVASARDALDSALGAWQKGGKIEQLPATSPSIHVVDHQWQAGKVLEGYEIVEEKPGAAETEKRFAVLLKLKKPEGEKRVEYIAVGREPLWIFRDDDYTKNLSMGDDTKPSSKSRPARRH